VIFTLFISPVFSAPIAISGAQDGQYEAREYIVADSVIIEQGDTLTFEAGTTVRFLQYAGIRIYGTLVAAGSSRPVIFTSSSDTSGGEPKPFDWNGISLEKGAALRMNSTKITFSTFGIDIDTNTNVLLENVVFMKNGRSNLAVDGKVIRVKDNAPFDSRFLS